MPDIEILNADALSLAPTVFTGAHCQIVDPPYSEHVHANAASIGTGGRGAQARNLGFGHLSPELRAHIQAVAGVVSRWTCVFSDFEGSLYWAAAPRGVEYVRSVPWIRWSQPQLSGDRPCTGREEVVILHSAPDGKPVRKSWNGPGSLLCWHDPVDAEPDVAPGFTHFSRRALRGKEKHPTQKPLDLILDLVSWFSDPGQIVLDLCSGSGTTALACQMLDRHCVAVEQDANWVQTARLRLKTPHARDVERAKGWVDSIVAEASRVPTPKAANGSDVKTWERAQRRLEDARRVASVVGVEVAA